MRDEAVRFLYDRINYERFASMPYGERTLKLDRMRRLLHLLGDPQLQIPTIHIAGTKGKGSTGKILTSILQASGYRVGHFSSPHLERLEERFQINGLPCPEKTFIETVARIRPACEAMDRESDEASPTFFEATTALAWNYFIEEQVDFAIMEVGMGGRLDSTNVCNPFLTLITSIGLDHTEQLGDTLEAIAGEKAGIVKPGIPVVSGVREDGPIAVIEEICCKEDAPLVRRGVDFDLCPASTGDDSAFDFLANYEREDSRKIADLRISLLGKHQRDNAALAIASVDLIRQSGWNVPEESLRKGLATAKCPGCVEHVGQEPDIVLDGAHNEISILALLETIKSHFKQSRPQRRLLFACAADKNPEAMLRVLLPHFGSVSFTKFTTSPRGSKPDDLVKIARGLEDRAYRVFSNPVDAWADLRQHSTTHDLLCITGSIYLAGEIRSILRDGITD